MNRAEAYVLWDNKVTEALKDLNELRRNRIEGYSDVSISDPVLLLEEIRKERRLELAREGHRWLDLRRYGMPSISHVEGEGPDVHATIAGIRIGCEPGFDSECFGEYPGA